MQQTQKPSRFLIKSTTWLKVDVNHSERVGGRLVDGVKGLELINDVVELVQLGIGEPHVDYERLAELPSGQQALVQELAHVLVVHVSVIYKLL